MKRIGLFGGTFDPIHRGHLKAATAVRTRYGLDRIVFIPSAVPPHKKRSHVTRAGDRMEMIRMAVPRGSDFMISEVELKRKGPSYTVDTVNHFISVYPQNTAFYLIIGHDAFLEIDTWKSYLHLFSLIPFIVLMRPENGRIDIGPEVIDPYLKSKISAGYYYNAEKMCYLHPTKQPLYIFSTGLIEMSSTDIRERIKTRQAIGDRVPRVVIRFISDRGLYR